MVEQVPVCGPGCGVHTVGCFRHGVVGSHPEADHVVVVVRATIVARRREGAVGRPVVRVAAVHPRILSKRDGVRERSVATPVAGTAGEIGHWRIGFGAVWISFLTLPLLQQIFHEAELQFVLDLVHEAVVPRLYPLLDQIRELSLPIELDVSVVAVVDLLLGVGVDGGGLGVQREVGGGDAAEDRQQHQAEQRQAQSQLVEGTRTLHGSTLLCVFRHCL